MADKLYVPRSSAREKSFPDGGSLIRLSFAVDELTTFIKTHRNDKGYVNFIVSRRKSPSQFGDTHSVYLDEWKPQQGDLSKAADKAIQQAAKPADGKDDDVPF